MTFRNKLFLACESLLRVPPLLVIDEIFRSSFGFGGRPFKYGVGNDSPRPIPRDTVILSSKDPTTSLDLDSINNLVETPHQDYVDVINSTTSSVFYSVAEYLKDSWLRGLNLASNESLSANNPEEIVNNTSIVEVLNHYPGIGDISKLTAEDFAEDLMFGGQIIASFILFFAAVVMFMLATDNLIKLYSHLLSFATIYISYIAPPLLFSFYLSDLFLITINVTFRVFLIGVFFVSRSWPSVQELASSRFSSFLEPILVSMFFLTGMVNIPPLVFIAMVLILHLPIIFSFPKLYKFLMLSWGETKRVQNEYGLSHLIQVESGRLRVNTVFRLFWMTRAAYDGFFRCCDEPLSLIFRYVMVHGTETFTGIVGLTVTVAAVCHQIGDALLWLIYLGNNNEVDLNRFGSISTVLFFILSLQSGLTSLDPEKRLDRLLKNMALLGTALFHALHQLVAPLLHAFRSFQAVQIRAATLSIVFLCFSVGVTFSLLRWSTISTWSLAVLALAIEFKIKVFISLVISLVVYLSQLVQYPDILEKIVAFFRRTLPYRVMHFFDQLHDQISHEDMVFYLKTVANVAEFITGIFLFLNAVWIFLFESTSAIRAIGMSVHAYFNIWCEAHKGYRIYSQRKTASKKIMSLKDATDEQLKSRHDDVCSICYEGLESAKVTNCGHLYHAVCLRKWLYLQNTCPICHEILYKEDITEELTDAPGTPVQQQPARQNREILNRNLSEGNLVGNARDIDNNIPRRRAGGQFVNRLQDGIEYWDEIDGHETDIEDNDVPDVLPNDDSDSDSFVELEDLEVWNRDRNRDHEDRDRGAGGGLQAANGRGLVLFL